ncbi:NAD(P)/FAD-dependent oxidoreductase [Opitutus terrae]|uniref:NADH:ubiquinone reductase (non-electrogenic) n=1 Tax=Opitutus terrae (strain DSM 11246 / JCM 15787 / PB90-1) TaxID=452637 RepID=B1ZTY1_OPITP|nr:NAD(P)/FAD-dependent oxidoreductase [Opitutus terrae]ACB75863.1 FAD-dependent pyridine nucleotide-disulphide oxidoreductase [Opitutus terrae PB90-1]
MDASEKPRTLPHIVVVGAGFGGLTFCRKFPEDAARITVIDRQNHHLFQPLLYQVATAGLSAVDIAQPIRAILRRKKNLEVMMAEVTGFDLAARKVIHDRGETSYDYLVLAMGGRTSYFGHDDWERFAPGLKSLDDALEIRRRVLMSFECAETESDPQKRRELMTLIVVGGGPTGVELAGTFAELARTVLVRDFDRIDPSKARVLLIEGAPRVLAHFPPDLSASAQRQLERLGVEVRVGKHVKAIRHHEVEMPDGEIIRGIVIWAAGVSASPLTQQLGVETDRAGRIKVLPDLSLPGHPEVFVLGDLVTLTDPKGQVVPGVSPAAMQMGEHAVKLLAEEIRGRTSTTNAAAGRAPFVYWDKGSMATIGRSKAVAEIGRLHFSGYPAWMAWLFVHLIFLVGFRSKFSVFVQWVYSYLTYKRGARIITGATGTPPAGSA